MNLRKRYFFRNSIEVEEYHNGRYGAPGMTRQERKKPAPEQVEKQNMRNRVNSIRRLIKWNFKRHDYWITLTYRKEARPPDMEAAKKDIRQLLKKLRKIYSQAGIPMKWMLKTEIGSKGAVHHHMVLNRIDGADIAVAENWMHGGVYTVLMYERGDYQALAEYIAKPSKEKRFSRSRNLEKHEPEKRLMKRNTMEKEIRPPKGYYIDRDSVAEGINPVTGYPYRHYTLIRVKRRD